MFFLLLTVLCLGGVGLAERATHTPVEAIGAACAGGPPEKVWFEGNILHWRGKTAIHPVLSDNPLVAGQDLWVFDIDLNMTSGIGSFHGDVQPSAAFIASGVILDPGN